VNGVVDVRSEVVEALTVRVDIYDGPGYGFGSCVNMMFVQRTIHTEGACYRVELTQGTLDHNLDVTYTPG
jgi:hypothetical protein